MSTAVDPVVPWSMARIMSDMRSLYGVGVDARGCGGIIVTFLKPEVKRRAVCVDLHRPRSRRSSLVRQPCVRVVRFDTRGRARYGWQWVDVVVAVDGALVTSFALW